MNRDQHIISLDFSDSEDSPGNEPAPVPSFTQEQLIEHIKKLTENQNTLMSTIDALKRKAEDPFM